LYIAELKGKAHPSAVGSEDMLTSNVFSFFKYIRRDIFLRRFLKILNIYATDLELEKAEFRFWPRYDDNTEPDLVLIVGTHYLLIEAKYRSDFAKETDKIEPQLIRESVAGRKEAEEMGLQFTLLGLTADYYYPANKFKEIPKDHMDHVQWMNWQRICSLIFEIKQDDLPLTNVERLFTEDFYQLLVNKRLRPYKGTSPLEHLETLQKLEGELFFSSKASHYSGIFIGFGNALSSHKGIDMVPSPIFFNKQPMWQSLSDIRMSLQSNDMIFEKGWRL
jgi:hypothetical protein